MPNARNHQRDSVWWIDLLAVFSLLAAFCSKCACIVFIQWWRCFMPGNLKASPT